MDVLRHLATAELQALVVACIHTPDEQLVMALSFEAGLMPRQVQQAHPQRFPSPRAVSLIKERVLTRLRHALTDAKEDFQIFL